MTVQSQVVKIKVLSLKDIVLNSTDTKFMSLDISELLLSKLDIINKLLSLDVDIPTIKNYGLKYIDMKYYENIFDRNLQLNLFYDAKEALDSFTGNGRTYLWSGDNSNTFLNNNVQKMKRILSMKMV